jgi:hypothetical protein
MENKTWHQNKLPNLVVKTGLQLSLVDNYFLQ